MPRFFFHLFDDIQSMDAEGQELESVEAARAQAIKSAQEMACAEVLDGTLNLNHRIEVVDEAGETVASVLFGDVVDVKS